MSDEKFIQAQEYNLDRNLFGYFMIAINFSAAVFMLFGGLLWFWNLSGQVVTYFGYDPSEEDNEVGEHDV